MIPNPMRKIVFSSVKKEVVTALNHQGFGRHSREEIYAFGIADIRAAANYIDDKQFFFGDEPSSVDASVFAGLFNILVPPMDSPPKTELKTHENLVAYCDRFVKRFDFPIVK